jgi:hypothetical protein
MGTGERANAVWREKLVLIQHPEEHAPELRFVEDGKQVTIARARHVRRGDRLEQCAALLDHPRQPIPQPVDLRNR